MLVKFFILISLITWNSLLYPLELDAKLELFLSIQETCSQLHKVVEQYQERMQGKLFFRHVNQSFLL